MENASWDDLRALLAVHRHKSLLGAGRALGWSTSTTARRLEQLEAAVGRKLVVKTAGGTRLEPGALELVALAEQVELGLGAAGRTDAGYAGVVRVSTGEGFAGPVLPMLASVQRLHPRLGIELVAEARLVDIARGEADVGVRMVRTRSAALVQKAIGTLTFGLYASRSYVAERLRRVAIEPGDVDRLDFVGHTGDLRALPQGTWLASLGVRRLVFRTNADSLLVEAARESVGIAVLADVVGGAQRDLVRLDAPRPGPRVSVFLAFHREARRVPRVRAVVDAIEASFRRALPR